MKKSALALAVATALVGFGSAAYADTTLYGSARVSLDYVDENTNRDVGDFVSGLFDGDGYLDIVNNASRLGVRGEEDLGEGLSSESGAGGKGAAFHIDGLAAGFFHLFDLFLRFAEEGVGGPDGAGHAGDISFGKDFLYMRERFFIEDDGVGFGEVVEGGAFVPKGLLNGEEAVFRNVCEGAAAADGEHFFCAIGKEPFFDEDGGGGAGRGLHQKKGLFPGDFIEGKGLGEGEEGANDFSFPAFRKGGNPLFTQKGHEAAAGKAEGKAFEVWRNEPFFPAVFGKRQI